MARDRDEQAAVHAEVRLGGEVQSKKESAAAELGVLLAAVAHPELPAIVVVEDLHLMGSDLAEFLTNVAQRREGRPVFVIGTAWPEGHKNRVYDQWRRQCDIAGKLELVEMPELSPEDLVQLIRQYAPRMGTGGCRSTREPSAEPSLTRWWRAMTTTQWLFGSES